MGDIEGDERAVEGARVNGVSGKPDSLILRGRIMLRCTDDRSIDEDT